MIGEKIPVLDKGHVVLVDVMGDDSAIVQAARVVYGLGTKTFREDRGLIRYLLRNQHMTPFEMCELKFHVRVPMDVWRQWIRHRTASVNEYSTRYSIAIEDMAETSPRLWREQSSRNKQGSGGLIPEKHGVSLSHAERDFQEHARSIYQERLDAGVAREQARKDLPLSTYTEAYWKIDLRNLLHFLGLRMDSHAQFEIRTYANTIGTQIVAALFPITWEAFKDYHLDGATLSVHERALVAALIRGDQKVALQIVQSGSLTKRELDALEKSLGISLFDYLPEEA